MAEDNLVVVNMRASAVLLSKPQFKLVPGENNVPASVLKSNRENPNGVVESWFDPDYGFLSVKKGAKKARPLSENLAHLDIARAKDLVERCPNMDALRRWARTEKRSEINRALSKRMAELQNPVAEEQGAAGGEAAPEE